MVATPGRLCELLLEEELAVFQDLSGLRFLVVDEADRIVEEGHFAEVRVRSWRSVLVCEYKNINVCTSTL